MDLLKSTGHDRFAYSDFKRLQEFGISTVRECARWHLIESTRGEYRWGSLHCILQAAQRSGTQVILDLLHFGWPDHTDVFSGRFASDFGNFARAIARYLKSNFEPPYFIAPVNEVSFLSWGGGCVACINPYATGRGNELKTNLIKAAIAASETLLNELPGVRLVSPEPVIHIVGDADVQGDMEEAEGHRLAQFEAWDMLSGRQRPELGGRPEYLDIIGLNFYDRNQWIHNGPALGRTDLLYRPFREIVKEVWQRYRRPIFISETGAEDGLRAEWFNYVCGEVKAALDAGVPIHGVCLYPILNHPGWDDDRHCQNGMFDLPDERGVRNVHWPLAHAVRAQQRRFSKLTEPGFHELTNFRPDLPFASSLGFRFPKTSTPDEPVCEDAPGVLL